MLLLVLGHKGLLQSSGTRFLQQKLQLRAPYVTPLNILQVCLLTNFAGELPCSVYACSTADDFLYTTPHTAGVLLEVN